MKTRNLFLTAAFALLSAVAFAQVLGMTEARGNIEEYVMAKLS